MTLLVEIRCDNRNEKNPECWSHESSESFSVSKHSAQGAKEATSNAITAHKESGWVIKSTAAYCPSCVEFLGVDA